MYSVFMSSIREVATHAGVSPATVSRAFANPGLINEQTRSRVFDSARVLEYRPPSLRPGRMKLHARDAAKANPRLPDAIGFQFFTRTELADDTLAANTFYAPVLSGAQFEACEIGINLLVNTASRHHLLREPPRMVRERAVGGMLLVGVAAPPVLTAFAEHISEIVLVDHHYDNCPLESIISDSFGGAHAATRHLIELGHRRIGFFLGGLPMGTFGYRKNGFLCALVSEGITPDKGWIIGEGENYGAMAAELREVLRAPNRPTAMVAANDHNALMILQICAEIGVSVPRDLSVIGFDDIEFASHAAPPLTTVRVNKEFMGRYAVRRLWERITRRANAGGMEGETIPPISHILPVSLIQRSSCCPPST